MALLALAGAAAPAPAPAAHGAPHAPVVVSAGNASVGAPLAGSCARGARCPLVLPTPGLPRLRLRAGGRLVVALPYAARTVSVDVGHLGSDWGDFTPAVVASHSARRWVFTLPPTFFRDPNLINVRAATRHRRLQYFAGARAAG